MRLIDADKFEAFMYQNDNDDFDNGVQFVLEMIDKAPTVCDIEQKSCDTCIYNGVFSLECARCDDDYTKWKPTVCDAEQEPCDDCEVGNPCLYCEHEFKDKRIEQMCKDCIHARVYGANSMKCTLRDEIVFNDGRCNSFEPKVNEPCDDAVSRQYLIDIATKDGAYDYVSAQEIANAPSVRPQEPKTGHWIDTDEGFSPCECSECGKVEFKKSDYCPNCGARMVEPHEAEEEQEPCEDAVSRQAMIRCLMDQSVPEDSNCAYCCIYCENKYHCDCICPIVDKSKTEDDILKSSCTFMEVY